MTGERVSDCETANEVLKDTGLDPVDSSTKPTLQRRTHRLGSALADAFGHVVGGRPALAQLGRFAGCDRAK